MKPILLQTQTPSRLKDAATVSYLSRLEASSPALQSPLMTLPRLEKGMGMPISSEKVGTRSTWSTEVELWSLKLSLKWYNTLSIVCMG